MDIRELNPQQQLAITGSIDINAVVVAGAGSGKTTVLVNRAGYLMDDIGVDPENIMVVTFTNKAAAEVKERLASITPDINKMWVGTFHSICVRILYKFGRTMGIDNYTIMSSYDSKGVIRKVMTDNNIALDKAVVNNYSSKISKCKNNLTNATKMKDIARNDKDLLFSKIYQEYQEVCWDRKSFDFDDLIVYTVILLARVVEARDWFWDNILYLMVDESQDTNSAQFELVRLLVGSNNLFMVGDDWQSIYEWRGAKPEYLLDFEKHYPTSKTFKLEQNYRSTQTIVNASNALIKVNTIRTDKTMFSNKAKGDQIVYHICKDQNDEGNWVATEMVMLHSQCIDYKDMAILFRTNSQSRAFEDAFMKFGIPYKIIGALNFYDRKEIKDMLSFYKVMANPLDEDNFKRVLHLQKGFGDKAVEEIINYSTATSFNFIETLTNYPGTKRTQTGILNLTKVFSTGITKPSKFMESVLHDTGYLQDLIIEDTPEAKVRIENLEELMNLAVEMEANDPSTSISDFINKISLTGGADTENKEGAVSLMTLHSSKGLEFSFAFMVGMEETLLPHANSLFSDSSIEGERRLAYVGITRAKIQLYMTNAINRSQFGQAAVSNRPSRFIKEIPKQYICEI